MRASNIFAVAPRCDISCRGARFRDGVPPTRRRSEAFDTLDSTEMGCRRRLGGTGCYDSNCAAVGALGLSSVKSYSHERGNRAVHSFMWGVGVSLSARCRMKASFL